MQQRYFAAVLVCLFAIATASAQAAKDSTAQSQDSQEKAATSTVTSGEPTSQEMREAVQTTLDDYNEKTKEKVNNCRNGQYENNPLLAAQCLAVYAGGSTDKNSDYMVKITKFKKIACTKASGKPGYNCDYVLNLSETTPALLGPLGLTTQGGGQTKGRFVHSEDGWTVITESK